VDLLAAFLVPDVGRTIHPLTGIVPAIAEVWIVGYLLVSGVKTGKPQAIPELGDREQGWLESEERGLPAV
jgi:hypothetical protein